MLRTIATPLMALALLTMVAFCVPGMSLHPTLDVTITGLFVLLAGISLRLARAEHTTAASAVFLSALMLAIGSVIAVYGGISGADAVALPLVVMAAGLLRGARFAGIFTGVAVLLVLVLVGLESAGLTPVYPQRQTTVQATIIIVVVVAATGVFLVLALRELGRAESAASDSAAAAEHSERRLAEILAQSPDGFVVMATDGTVLDCNSKMEELIGKPCDGTQLADIPGLTSESSTLWLAALAEVLTGRPSHLVAVDIVRETGETVTLELHPRSATHADGRKVVHVIARDVTERKRIEEERAALAEQLQETHRLESLGRLAGGIAHDFNNLLTATVTNGELISMNEELPESVRLLGNEITLAGQRAGELTQQLLAYARKQVREPKVLELADVIRHLRPLLIRLLPEDIAIEISFNDRARVRADPSQLEQIVLNLASNARDAMPTGGRLTIETAALELDDAYCSEHPQITPGSYAALIVTDTGRGMDSETLEHVFEPFFSTKKPHEGVGLGLATVHGIVKQNEGHILVYSEPDAGTSFKVLLPAIDAPVTRRAEPTPQRPAKTTTGATILIVDDEPLVRETAARLLESVGYVVITAAHAGEAVEKAVAYQGVIDLIITDVVLPKRRGPDLVRELAESRPDMRVLYISGYTENTIVHNGNLDPGVQFLPKPFSLTTLADKVAEILTGSSPSRMH